MFSACDELLMMRVDVECCGQLSECHKCAIGELLDSLQKLSLFHVVEESLRSQSYKLCHIWDRIVKTVEDSPVSERSCYANFKLPSLKLAHFATMILMSWPYENSSSSDNDQMTNAALSSRYIAQEMSRTTKILKSEVEVLKTQLSTIFSYYHTMDSSYGSKRT